MPHYLLQAVIGYRPKVQISETEFLAIRRSMDAVLNTLHFEEEWDIVLGNFCDLERRVLDVALHDMIYSDWDWHDFNDIRVTFVRHLQNLLSSCRGYLDHSPQTLNRIDNTGGFYSQFKSETNRVYDASFAYRFMEALRNHAQHHGHPIHGAMFDARRVEQAHDTLWRYIAGATINIETLAANPKFKSSVLEEARAISGKLDAFYLSREYVEHLAEVHQHTRKAIEEAGVIRRDIIEEAHSKYVAASGEVLGLRAVADGTAGEPAERFGVLLEPFDRLRKLQRKNGSLHNLSKRYASGELAPRKQ